MDVKIMQECGHELAALGMSLSFKDRAISIEDWWTAERYKKITKTMEANAGRGKGHDKFLRQLVVYVMIEAPRYWWSEFDTYKIGTVANSESSMHTLHKRDLHIDDLEPCESDEAVIEMDLNDIKRFNYYKNNLWDGKSIKALKRRLPESYLQRRLVTMNYAVLACIIGQRKKHALPEWWTFINSIYSQVEHKELLPTYEEIRDAKSR